MNLDRAFILSLCAATTVVAQTNALNSSGNVGIGTTAPAHLLDVHGTIHTPHSAIFGDGHWNSEGINYEALSTYGGATIRGNSMVVGKFSIGSWTQSAPMNGLFVAGDSVFNGNVGVGTTTPLATLQVKSATNKEVQIGSTAGAFSTVAHYTDLSTLGSVINFSRPSDGAFAHSIFSYTSMGGGANLGIAARSDIKFVVGATADRGMIIKDSGDVGIGTTSPSNAQIWARVLDVYGAGCSKLLVTESSGVKTGIFSHTSWWPGGVGKIGTESAHPLALMAGYGNDVMTLLPSGNVGIGTTNPTHKLAVNGTIKAKEVIVETTGWSDYVFADDYRLAPLSEVEAHIKTNKHLPGIPSAAQVANEGVSVGELQAKLLAKIEELTLHQIAQEKLLKSQSDELASLRAEIRTLRGQ